MTQSVITVIVFIVVLAMLPGLLKWLQRKYMKDIVAAEGEIKIVSTLTVGPQQRILTIEVGPSSARLWLVVGITAQKIECIYTLPAEKSNTLLIKPSDTGIPFKMPPSADHDR